MIRFALRLPDELHERLTARASEDNRSINAELLYLIDAALKAPKGDVDRWFRHDAP